MSNELWKVLDIACPGCGHKRANAQQTHIIKGLLPDFIDRTCDACGRAFTFDDLQKTIRDGIDALVKDRSRRPTLHAEAEAASMQMGNILASTFA